MDKEQFRKHMEKLLQGRRVTAGPIFGVIEVPVPVWAPEPYAVWVEAPSKPGAFPTVHFLREWEASNGEGVRNDYLGHIDGSTFYPARDRGFGLAARHASELGFSLVCLGSIQGYVDRTVTVAELLSLK